MLTAAAQRITLSEHTPSQISWIGSFQLFLLFAVALPSGRLYDEGYFRWLVGGGALLYLFSYVLGLSPLNSDDVCPPQACSCSR